MLADAVPKRRDISPTRNLNRYGVSAAAGVRPRNQTEKLSDHQAAYWQSLHHFRVGWSVLSLCAVLKALGAVSLTQRAKLARGAGGHDR